MKVCGQWACLCCALDKHGNTVDFHFSPTRDAVAAKRVLGKALNGLKDWEKPGVTNSDKAPTYGAAASAGASAKAGASPPRCGRRWRC